MDVSVWLEEEAHTASSVDVVSYSTASGQLARVDERRINQNATLTALLLVSLESNCVCLNFITTSFLCQRRLKQRLAANGFNAEGYESPVVTAWPGQAWVQHAPNLTKERGD